MQSPTPDHDVDSAEFYRDKAARARTLALASTDPATADMLTAEAAAFDMTADRIDARATERGGERPLSGFQLRTGA